MNVNYMSSTDAAPLCDFCGHRRATLLDVQVPLWLVVGGGQSPKTKLHNLCQLCHDMTFPPRQTKEKP